MTTAILMVFHVVALRRSGPTIPGELFAKFQNSFYADSVDAVIKAIVV